MEGEVLGQDPIIKKKNKLCAVMFQVFQSGNPRADEIVLSNMAMAFDRMFFDVEVFFNYLLYHYVCIASNVCLSTIYQYWIQVISFYESLV